MSTPDDKSMRGAALRLRLTAIEKRAEMAALDMKVASLYLDMGMPPEHVRDFHEDPATADAMNELLREEARIRQAFEERNAAAAGRE